MKKIIFLLALLCLSFNTMAYDFIKDGIYYKITSQITVEVTSQTLNSPNNNTNSLHYSGSKTIPPQVTYNENTYTVTKIGDYAFSRCVNLVSVLIPSTVTKIGTSAFFNCNALTSINIPNSVTTIGSSAFSDCIALTSIDIPNSVTTIGSSAFSNCTSLNSVNIPNSVTTIGKSAFLGCSSLTSITIPKSVTKIGHLVFYNCKNLTSLEVDISNPYYLSLDNVLYNKNRDTLIYCATGKEGEFFIPNSVNTIYSNAFSWCIGLNSVIIPSSVTTIGDSAFSDCRALTSINIPNSITKINYRTFIGCSGLTSLNIPNSVTTIGGEAFRSCESLTSLNIPNSVTTIGEGAFSFCEGLTSLNIPNSVKTIRSWAFSYCKSLESLELSEGLDSIGFWAFAHCTKLSTIIVPSSVRFIDYGAFAYCDNLTTLKMHLENSYYYSFDNVVYDNTKTKLVACATGKEGHFEIDNRINDILPYAFGGSKLSSVTIPENIKKIGNRTFDFCYNLQEANYNAINAVVYWENGAPVLDNQCLPIFVLAQIKTLNIGNKVNTIPDCAFSSNYITSITIPNSVKKIGKSAFNNSFLTEIKVLSRTPPSIEKSNITYKTYIPIYVPKGSVERYKSTKFWEDFTNYQEFPFNDIALSVNNKTMGYIQGADGCEDGEVELEAIANYGYQFKKWNDESTENPRKVFVTTDTSFMAIFDVNKYELKVLSEDSTKGITEGSGIFDYYTTQTIRAIANYGYEFEKWNTGLLINPAYIRITGNMEFKASFKIRQYELNVLSSDTMQGNVDGSGKYDYNTTQTIVAIANGGYVFDKWNDDNRDNPRKITILNDTSFTASFKKDISLDIVNKNDNSILIYPNPSCKKVNIKMDNFRPNSTLSISDNQGRIVKTQNINSSKTTIDISPLSKGVYFIKIGNVIEKLVVE